MQAEADFAVQVSLCVPRPVSQGTGSQEAAGSGLEEGCSGEAQPVSLHQGWEDLHQGEGRHLTIILLFVPSRTLHELCVEIRDYIFILFD